VDDRILLLQAYKFAQEDSRHDHHDHELPQRELEERWDATMASHAGILEAETMISVHFFLRFWPVSFLSIILPCVTFANILTAPLMRAE
jgi:hypothetical protein